MTFDYQEVVMNLKRQFPKGTVQFREDNGRPYIPNQVYTDRVESATNSQWDKEIKELDINVPHRYVKSIVRITIGPHFRDGYGLAVIKGDPENNQKAIVNAVDQAVNVAVLEALDTFQMGWKDLAPYKQHAKDWGSNPALKHLLEDSVTSDTHSASFPIQSFSKCHHRCIFCGRNLTEGEWDLLGQIPNLNRNKMIYCFDHLPNHLKRKLREEVLSDFEEKWLNRIRD
ncbi:hypothetical protein P4K96_18325 [Bacillus cereus]|nr:hypothetical protein [Bacillus cereus]